MALRNAFACCIKSHFSVFLSTGKWRVVFCWYFLKNPKFLFFNGCSSYLWVNAVWLLSSLAAPYGKSVGLRHTAPSRILLLKQADFLPQWAWHSLGFPNNANVITAAFLGMKTYCFITENSLQLRIKMPAFHPLWLCWCLKGLSSLYCWEQILLCDFCISLLNFA